MFYFCRVVIGSFSYYCQSVFCNTIYWKVDNTIGSILYYLMYCTAGILFYSTSLLPSAICCNLLMLSISNYIRKSDLWAIAWGCIAVCCTGWPFVGVLFLPMGLHMLYRQLFSAPNRGILALLVFVVKACILLGAICACTVSIDSIFYHKRYVCVCLCVYLCIYVYYNYISILIICIERFQL